MPICLNKLKRSCRLCLSQTEKPKRYELFAKSELEAEASSYDGDGDSQRDEFSKMPLYEKVEYCCGLRLVPKAKLPSRICGKCFYMIHMWFNFRQMSLNSQQTLAAQTQIKLEDCLVACTPLELQETRSDLIRRQAKPRQVANEFILPDVRNVMELEDSEDKGEELGQRDKQEGIVSKLDIEILQENAVAEGQLHVDVMANESNATAHNVTNATDATDEEEEANPHSLLNDQTKEDDVSETQDINENTNEYSGLTNVAIGDDNVILNVAMHDVSLGLEQADLHESLMGNVEDAVNEEDIEISDNEAIETDDTEKTLSSENQTYKKCLKQFKKRRSKRIEQQHVEKEDLSALDNNIMPENVNKEGYDTNDSLAKDDDDSDDDAYEDDMKKDSAQALNDALNFLLADGKLVVDDDQSKSVKNKNRKKPAQKRKLDKQGSKIKELFPPAREEIKFEKPDKYICSVCGNIYKKWLSFKRHLATHSTEKLFECEICQKAFRDVSFLKKHMVVHTGEKRYKCKYCDIRYTDASSRHRHQKTHTGPDVFPCNICGKTFSYKSVLKRHLVSHTGEKEFSCGVCNAAFVLPHHLKAHIGTASHKAKQEAYEALGFKSECQFASPENK